MKYMLLMHVPRGTGDYQSTTWSAEDWQAHLDYWRHLNKELTESGELVGVEALAPPARARVVRGATNGVPAVTDGPFAEAKEFLAGYWIVDVAGAERAYEIAATASLAPGPGGTPLTIPIEVREVIGVPAADVAPP